MDCDLQQEVKFKIEERPYRIYDAVHGFIRFNVLEKWVIDSPAFQRLHGIHQLGMAYLVYPGATHTRFEHSLGTMHLAMQIFERITKKGFTLSHEDYWLQIVRLAALCHDLGHPPFSHDAEKELLGEVGHEVWTYKIILSLEPLFAKIGEYFPGRDIMNDVLRMAIGEKKLVIMGVKLSFSPLENVLSQIVTGDFFGADRIDYLLRDAQCTGVSHGFFDYQQLIEMITVLPSKGTLELGVEENGVESCEALLLARHFMHQRVYKYISVKIAKFHLARFMIACLESSSWLDDLEGYLSLDDHAILVAIKLAAKDPKARGHEDALGLTNKDKRFKALLLEEGGNEEALRAHLEGLGIPAACFFIEPPSSKEEIKDLSFSVQTRSLKIVPAKDCAHIFVQNRKERWVYVSPEYEKSVSLFLQTGTPR